MRAASSLLERFLVKRKNASGGLRNFKWLQYDLK